MSDLLMLEHETELHEIFTGLALGTIQLWDVAPSLMGVYELGYFQGIQSQQGTIQQLEHEADRLYLAAFNPPERARLIEQRMQKAATRLPLGVLADSREGIETQLRAATRRAA